MSASTLERHDLEQDIDELRGSIDSLESTRTRLRNLLPETSAAAPASIWSDLTNIVTDLFQVAGEAMRDPDAEGGDDNPVAEAGRRVKKVVTTDWSEALGTAFTRLRERVVTDLGLGSPSEPPVAELAGVLAELDSEIARLGGDLQQKLDRVAEIDRSADDSDVSPAPRPHHRDVTQDDTTIVTPRDDDLDVTPRVVDVDVTPIPVDVLPDVDPAPVVIPDHDTDLVVPVPHVDVTLVVDVVPTPPVVVPDTDDDDTHTTVTDDDTPAYDPGNATEIGELDGAIYDVNEILANGRSVSDLRKYDVPAGVVLDAGVSASALLDGGYSVADLKEAGLQAADLHGLASAADLRGAGYTAGDLHGVFTVAECADAFSPHELRDGGFSVSEFHGVFSVADLRDVFSVAELRSVYDIGDLRAAGFDAADLSAGGASWAELASAGFSLQDLENAGAGESTLREIFPHDFPQADTDTDSQ